MYVEYDLEFADFYLQPASIRRRGGHSGTKKTRDERLLLDPLRSLLFRHKGPEYCPCEEKAFEELAQKLIPLYKNDYDVLCSFIACDSQEINFPLPVELEENWKFQGYFFEKIYSEDIHLWDCPKQKLHAAREVLVDYFGQDAYGDLDDPYYLVCLSRLANWLGKVSDCMNYSVKTLVFSSVVQLSEEGKIKGISYGWNHEEGVFYLSCGYGCDSSAHDPNNELYNLLFDLVGEKKASKKTELKWNGKRLQAFAVEIIKGIPVTKERLKYK